MEIEDGKAILDINYDDMRYKEELEGFLEVVEEAANLMIEKVNKYGNARYKRKNFDFDSKMIYSDVNRKFIRLENITWNFENLLSEKDSRKILMEDLRESYIDTLNYCVIAMQLIDKNLEVLEDG